LELEYGGRSTRNEGILSVAEDPGRKKFFTIRSSLELVINLIKISEIAIYLFGFFKLTNLFRVMAADSRKDCNQMALVALHGKALKAVALE